MDSDNKNKELEPKINESPPAEDRTVSLEDKPVVRPEIDWRVEAEKYLDQCLRAQADLENTKKRLEREKAEFFKFANENLIKDLLPVLDNLERALNHAEENEAESSALIDGVRLTHRGIMCVLEKFGVRPVNALGEAFDPNYHEAVMEREDPDAEPKTVLEEMQKGY
ncbi:MAG: nucleotide exchange factor GrpE, partial [Pseudomonadota bacterium]